MLGIPSIAISIGTFRDPHWETAATYAQRLGWLVLKHGLPSKVLLNVNVPNLALGEVKGVRVTRQGDSGYEEKFDLHRDSRSIPYYWRTGSYKMSDVEEGTDALALANGFVSVTPVSFDLTCYDMLEDLTHWDLS